MPGMGAGIAIPGASPIPNGADNAAFAGAADDLPF